MTDTDRVGKRRLHAAALILGGVLAVYGSGFGGWIYCEAKEPAATAKQDRNAKVETGKKTAADDAEQEVIDFITSFYKAQTSEKVETLADYVDDPECRSFQIDLLRWQVTFRHGVKGWKNIEVLALPMSDGKHWLTEVSSELVVEGIDVGIPGMRADLVSRNEKGELKVALYDNAGYSDRFMEELRELSLSDEVVERSNEVVVAFNDLVAERSDITEWVLEANEAIEQEMAELLAREEALFEKADTEGEGFTAEKGSYTVKKGDCLWDIAAEQLGDGMRWSRLYEQNKDVVGENPDLLYVGTVLQLKYE